MMLRVFKYAAAFATMALLAGCAQFPAGTTQRTVREMSFRIDFAGSINDNDYYFVPVDTDGGGGYGPVPVFPGITAGEGWLIASTLVPEADYHQTMYYVEYHQRQYTVFKVTHLQPFQSELVGAPVRSTIPEIGSRTLQFTLDLNSIAATSDSVDVNVITTDQPVAGVRLLDSLGRTGNDYLNIDILTSRTITNSEGLIPEMAGDVMDQNMTFQPKNEQTDPLDITDWSITVDI
jgi:hypothetical protein